MKYQRKQITPKQRIYNACIILKWPEVGDKNLAMKTILDYSTIKKKINYEALKRSKMNLELDRKELESDIKTILYLAIQSEFNLNIAVDKIIVWLTNRIEWRSLDFIKKECELIWEKNKNGLNYRRIEKIQLDEVTETQSEDDKYISRGNQTSAMIEKHNSLESFIRKSNIKLEHKMILIYSITMAYTLNELASLYGVSRPTIITRYKKAKLALKKYVDSLGQAQRDSIYNLLSGIKERQ